MSKQQQPVELESLRGSIAIVTGAGNNSIGWGLCTRAAGQLGMHVVTVDLHENLVTEAERRLRDEYPDVSIGLSDDSRSSGAR